MKAEVLKGHLDALLLATLEAGPRHGYAIIDAVRTGSAGRIDLPTGTVSRPCTASSAPGWSPVPGPPTSRAHGAPTGSPLPDDAP